MRYLLLLLTITWSVLLFSQEEETMVTSKDSIVEFINCPAEFPGGKEELTKFLAHNFEHSYLDTNVFKYGKIYLTLLVEANGKVTEIDFIIFDRDRDTTISVLKEGADPFPSMPIWKPACDEKGTVSQRVTIPLNIDP